VRVESESTTIRSVCAVLWLGATGRLRSLLAMGKPHPLYLALMINAFGLPFVVVPWQSAAARQHAE
jgi:hypothetical protein